MDVGPQPKIALFLSLTLMNLVAVGICIYAPSPKDRKASLESKKELHVVFKKRVGPSLDDGVEAKSGGATTDKITAEEDNLKNESDILEVIPQPPAVEDSELVVKNDPISLPDELEKNKNNLNVITINKNFDNDSSKEGSDISLDDTCGHGAEMRYLPQDLGKSVTAVITKSFQLIDTFNTRVVPAVENFNEQIAKTARFERSMDSSVVGAINTSICPAVIRMSDSINRMNEKINRVTENINRTNEPKERSVSCQVSESLLVKSVRQKNSFFSSVSTTCEARILTLFGHISCRMISRRKDRPTFKTSTVQYWTNRQRTLMRKFRKVRSKVNLQRIKTTDESITHEESVVIESCSTFSDVDQQLRHFQKMSSKEIVKEETVGEEPRVLGDFCNDDEELVQENSKETREANSVEEEIKYSIECKQEAALEEPVVAPSFHSSGGERDSSLPSNLPSYLSSYDEFDAQGSSANLEETSQKFQDPPFNYHVNNESREQVKSGSEDRISPNSLVSMGSESQNTSFITAPEFLNEEGGQGLATKHDTILGERSNKSLQLSSTVQNTFERMCGPLNSRRGLQDVLDMLDPSLERNTVENLFLLILKIFDAWSESQLTVVPSRALSRISPSESTCMNSLSVRSKSVGLFEDNIERLNKMSGPANYYSCTDMGNSGEVQNVYEASDICEDEEQTARVVVKGIVEEALSRTPECTEIEISRSSQFQETSSAAITNNPELNLKAILYKEQYSLARKIAAECIETALCNSDADVDYIHSTDEKRTENTMQKNMTRKSRTKLETADSVVALRVSSEESFYSWAPESSSDDYSYYECDGSLGSLEPSDKSLKKGIFDRPNVSKRNLTREEEKRLPICLEVKENRSEAQCSNAYYVSRPGSAVVLKTSSIESWMLNSTSGDGVEIRNSHSELKSEEMSDLSSRPISFTTDDMSDGESNHSLVETTASESSKDVQIRRKWSSRLFSKLKKKRPKTPKTAISAAEAPSHAQSDCAMKVSESIINRNASLSDEN